MSNIYLLTRGGTGGANLSTPLETLDDTNPYRLPFTRLTVVANDQEPFGVTENANSTRLKFRRLTVTASDQNSLFTSDVGTTQRV